MSYFDVQLGDFNLGQTTMTRKTDNERYFYITNFHFVKYRSKFGKNGDFQVLPDVQHQNISLAAINVWNK